MSAVLVIFDLPDDSRIQHLQDNVAAVAERMGGSVSKAHVITEVEPDRAVDSLAAALALPVRRACARLAARKHLRHRIRVHG